MAHQRLLLAALALTSVPAAFGCGKSMGLCGADGSCPSGQFCNFAKNRVQRRTAPSCERCGGGPTHHSDGSKAKPCECGLPSRGHTECQNVCEDTGPKTGAGGCCCRTFMGSEVQSASACTGWHSWGRKCADTDLGCCAPVFSSNGVCNELENANVAAETVVPENEQCVNGSGTTPYPGWDAYDCRPGAGDTNHTNLSPGSAAAIIVVAILVSIIVVIAGYRKKLRQKAHLAAAVAAVAYGKGAADGAAKAANPAAAAVANPVAATVGVVQAMQAVQMQCPAGSGAGSVVQAEVNGKVVQITVPAGVSEGQMFQVQVPV